MIWIESLLEWIVTPQFIIFQKLILIFCTNNCTTKQKEKQTDFPSFLYFEKAQKKHWYEGFNILKTLTWDWK